jgi:hypothetical protein
VPHPALRISANAQAQSILADACFRLKHFLGMRLKVILHGNHGAAVILIVGENPFKDFFPLSA